MSVGIWSPFAGGMYRQVGSMVLLKLGRDSDVAFRIPVEGDSRVARLETDLASVRERRNEWRRAAESAAKARDELRKLAYDENAKAAHLRRQVEESDKALADAREEARYYKSLAQAQANKLQNAERLDTCLRRTVAKAEMPWLASAEREELRDTVVSQASELAKLKG